MTSHPCFSARRAGPVCLSILALLAALGLAAACGSDGGATANQTHGGQTGDEYTGVVQPLRGDTERRAIEGEAAGQASAELDAFAWSFYREASAAGENFVYSPYSIATAASMLYAGAAGNTQAEMGAVFGFGEEGEDFHQARNDLLQYLDARNREATEETNAQILQVSNDFWMAERLMPQPDFLNTLSSFYGAPVHVFDVGNDEVRQAINAKVASDTNDLIDELLPADSIDADTIFVLTNALYFKARWEWEFPLSATAPADFNTLDGTTAQVDMMHATGFDWGYRNMDGVEVVSMAYFGRELEFVAMMPPAGQFEDFAAGLTSAEVDALADDLPGTNLDLAFPKLDLETEVPLKDELIEAGMVDAWVRDSADFSPLAENRTWLGAAFHQTHVILDEEGTEAAAATAFVGVDESAPPAPIPVTFDRPFVFFIRDIETQAVLFLGHLTQP